MENKAPRQSRLKKSKPSPQAFTDLALRALKTKMLFFMGDAYCAVWDVLKGKHDTRADKVVARNRSLDTIEISIARCEGVMVEMEARK